MQGTSTQRQFGLLIAYVIPGFVALAGLAPVVPVVREWLRPTNLQGDLALGPPLYAVLAAVTLGSILSCFRWLLVDKLHSRMGVRRPQFDDRRLAESLGAMEFLVVSHFRYAEFCGNTLLALLFTYALNRLLHTSPYLGLGTDLAALVVASVLFAASRDALATYYSRAGRLVGLVAKIPYGADMYNGADHGGSSAKPKPEPKPVEEPKTPVKPQSSDPKNDKGDR